MKRIILMLAAGAVIGLAVGTVGHVSADEESEIYQVSQSGAGAFVILNTIDGSWEQVNTRPSAAGSLTVIRGVVGRDHVEKSEIRIR